MLPSTHQRSSHGRLLVMLAGWALAVRSLCGLVLAALFVPPLIARMRSEERCSRSISAPRPRRIALARGG
jgi:hypothetical protein